MAIIKEKGLIKADDPILNSGFSIRAMVKTFPKKDKSKLIKLN